MNSTPNLNRISPRLKKDFSDLISELKKDIPKNEVVCEADFESDITDITPVSPNYNKLISEFTVLLRGPSGTPYQGGLFRLKITLNDSYPFRPPTIEFLTPIYHPNIKDRSICLDILNQSWSPMLNLHKIILSLSILLSNQNEKDPLNSEAGNILKYDIEYKTENFKKKAIEWTKLYSIPDKHFKYLE